MKFEELKCSLQLDRREGPLADIDIEQVRKNVTRTRHTLRLRDLRESIACIVIVVLFSPAIFADVTVMARVGAAVICLAATFIGVWLYLGHRRHRALPELSVGEFLEAEIAHLDYQIWLLRNVSWWYLAPLAIGFLIFVWGTSSVVFGVVASLGYYLLDRGIYWLNQRAVKNDLILHREELALARQTFYEMNED